MRKEWFTKGKSGQDMPENGRRVARQVKKSRDAVLRDNNRAFPLSALSSRCTYFYARNSRLIWG